jgi:hypothetical protein
MAEPFYLLCSLAAFHFGLYFGAHVTFGHGQLKPGLKVHPETGGVVPKYLDKRSAVSADIPRLPFSIWVIRPEGTRSARASLFAERLRAVISRFKMRPGCIGFIGLPFAIICYFNVVCIAILESKADAPGAIDRHGPLTNPISFQFVKANAF